MLNLCTPVAIKNILTENFDNGEKLSVVYHNIFDYPLTFAELIKWKSGISVLGITNITDITSKNGYFFVEGKEGLIYKRLLRERISAKKMEIAKKASKFLSLIPSIKMVAVTGSLAMQNSTEESDIDLMIVTKKGLLWTTRLLGYLVTWLLGIKTRRSGDKVQKDKLCLNMWFDESDLIWLNRNVYTAHEIAQIVPLVNKEKTYERFLRSNRWILRFWPNAVRIKGKKGLGMSPDSSLLSYFLIPFEKLAFNLQKIYMRKKVTRETVTSSRALFHPQDWGKVVMGRLVV